MTKQVCFPKNILFQKFDAFFKLRAFPIIIFAIGAIMRLKHYWENRSLWLDEAYLSLDIANTPLFQLATFQTLLPGQPRQPVGFLVSTKIITMLLGLSEYALRLFPLITSILSLILIYILVKKVLGRKEALWSLGIFALAEPLIYYAAEVKPYSCELFVALIIFIFSSEFLSHKISRTSIWFTCLIGIFSIWFSTSSLLILPSIILLLFYKVKTSEKKNLFMPLLMCAAILFLNFILIYINSLSKMLSSEQIMTSSLPYFAPRPLFSLNSIVWILKSFTGIFENSMGLGFGPFLLILSIFGCHQFFKKNKTLGWLFALPIITFLVANVLYKYPFHYRMLLFLIPGLTIFLVNGIAHLFEKFPRINCVSNLLILTIIFCSSLSFSLPPFLQSHKRSETRPLVKELKNNFIDGDALIYNNSAQYAYGFYHGLFKMGTNPQLVLKLEDWKSDQHPDSIKRKYLYIVFNKEGYWQGVYKDETTQYLLSKERNTFDNNSRTWLLLSHLPQHQEQEVVSYFSNNGKLLSEKKLVGASLYLFNMMK